MSLFWLCNAPREWRWNRPLDFGSLPLKPILDTFGDVRRQGDEDRVSRLYILDGKDRPLEMSFADSSRVFLHNVSDSFAQCFRQPCSRDGCAKNALVRWPRTITRRICNAVQPLNLALNFFDPV